MQDISPVDALRGSILIAHEQLRASPSNPEDHCLFVFWPVVAKCCHEALSCAEAALHDQKFDTCLNLLRLLEAILDVNINDASVTRDPVSWLCQHSTAAYDALKAFEHDSIRLLREFEEKRTEATGWTGNIPLSPARHITTRSRSPGTAARSESPTTPSQQHFEYRRVGDKLVPDEGDLPSITDHLPPITSVQEYAATHNGAAPPQSVYAAEREKHKRERAHQQQQQQQQRSVSPRKSSPIAEIVRAAQIHARHEKVAENQQKKQDMQTSVAAAAADTQQTTKRSPTRTTTTTLPATTTKFVPRAPPKTSQLGRNVTPDGRTIGFAPGKMPQEQHPWYVRYHRQRRVEMRPLLTRNMQLPQPIVFDPKKWDRNRKKGDDDDSAMQDLLDNNNDNNSSDARNDDEKHHGDLFGRLQNMEIVEEMDEKTLQRIRKQRAVLTMQAFSRAAVSSNLVSCAVRSINAPVSSGTATSLSSHQQMHPRQQQQQQQQQQQKKMLLNVSISSLSPTEQIELVNIRKRIAARTIMRVLRNEKIARQAWTSDLQEIAKMQDLLFRRTTTGTKQADANDNDDDVVDDDSDSNNNPVAAQLVSNGVVTISGATANTMLKTREQCTTISQSIQNKLSKKKPMLLMMVSLTEIEMEREREAAQLRRIEEEKEEKRRQAVMARREELNRKTHSVQLLQRVGRAYMRRVVLAQQLATFYLTGASFARLSYVMAAAHAANAALMTARSESVWDQVHRHIMGEILTAHPDWEIKCYNNRRRDLIRSVTLIQAMLRWHKTTSIVDYLQSREAVEKIEATWLARRAKIQNKLNRLKTRTYG